MVKIKDEWMYIESVTFDTKSKQNRTHSGEQPEKAACILSTSLLGYTLKTLRKIKQKCRGRKQKIKSARRKKKKSL